MPGALAGGEACGRASPVSQRRRETWAFTGMLPLLILEVAGRERRAHGPKRASAHLVQDSGMLASKPHLSQVTRGQMPAQGQAARPA